VQRSTKLSQVIADLAGSGKNILLSINQHVAPTYGQADPIAPILARFGIIVDSGRPLMSESVTPQGRLVLTDHTVLPEGTSGLLPGAIRGLPMLAPWAVSFHLTTPDASATQSQWPLYSILPNERVWAETNWLQMWQTPRNQRPMMPNAPVFDANRDAKTPQGAKGEREDAWLIALAVERRPSAKQPQRLVAVGSREWLLNYAMQPRAIDGRNAAITPGNIELLESSVFWLAGQDDLIAQSPTAQVVSLIQPMDEKVLSGLRTTMILGLPLLVLAIGVVYRLIRG
jgi:hypothetical protein